MLELINIHKTYATKKGVSVNALNGVSLVFGETGLVFVTGKSGSGKSTLLNLIGGLDTYDTGDMIINQKSSQLFKQKDFDSYRNTMVGFIFQEYNILDEFSVAQNIGLALALQGQKVTDDAINDLLNKLDIEGLGSRNPNELSGGQKQRVAIARALVKEPKIILADEPTGALDSATGHQLLETLKELSKDRLVIVISHDLEFAEKYADRIIHFIDGKVDYDVTQTSTIQTKEEPVTLTDEGIIIQPNYELTHEDLVAINAYLKRHKKSTTIKKGTIQQFNSFEQTKIEDINQSTQPFELIKSKLPFKASMSMALNALSHKKIRLVFSIILTSIALIMFGVIDTFSNFSAAEKAYNIVKGENYNHLVLGHYEKPNYNWGMYNQMLINDTYLEDLEALYPNLTSIPIYPNNHGVYPESHIKQSFQEQSLYDVLNFYNAIEIDQTFLDKSDFELYGSLPSTLDQVVIPHYLYDAYKRLGYYTDEGDTIVIETLDDIIGKTIRSSNSYVTITGVIDYKIDLSRYDSLKDISKSSNINSPLSWEYSQLFDNSIVDALVFKKGYNTYHVNDSKQDVTVTFYNDDDFYSLNRLNLMDADALGNALLYKDVDPNQLGPNDVLMDYYILTNRASAFVDIEVIQSIQLDYVTTNYLEDIELILNDHYPAYEVIEDIPEEDLHEIVYVHLAHIIFDDADYEAVYESILRYYLDHKPLSTYNISYRNGTNTVNVVGYIKREHAGSNSSVYYVNEVLYNDIKEELEVQFYNILTLEQGLDKATFYKMVNDNLNHTLEYRFQIRDSNVEYLVNLSDNLEGMQEFFFWVALVLAAFSGLLMFSFISSSIAYKKQEIGILRAIGASSKDVLSIFSWETLVISVVNIIISIFGTILFTVFLNQTMQVSLGLRTTLLDFGFRQLILLIVISLGIGYISSALPVLKTARKKPIDAIKNK